jgi:hypothetical protein
VTLITVETRPGSLGRRDGQHYACATGMPWIERFGGYLALAFLAFMWLVVDVLQKGRPTTLGTSLSPRAPILLPTAGTACGDTRLGTMLSPSEQFFC